MHVDGFRFDLASVLGRGRDGAVHPDAPLLEIIARDPVLARTKLIAEAWDAAGLYQVGSFPSWGRWAEWNGKFRDDLRRFVKSDAGDGGRPPDPPLRQPRPLPPGRPRALAQHQLRHQPRRLHPARPRELHAQAQPAERRAEPRRLRRQPVLELRGGRGDGRSRGARPAGPPGAERDGPAPALPGRAHAPGRRRGAPHPGREQQRLLPGQRDELVRLAAARRRTPTSCASSPGSSASGARHPSLRRHVFFEDAPGGRARGLPRPARGRARPLARIALAGPAPARRRRATTTCT